MSHIIY